MSHSKWNFTDIWLASIAVLALTLAAAPVWAQSPMDEPDDSWVSVTGTVTSTTESTFKLDYGDGIVTVEMDDWDTYDETFALNNGDQVTVYGEVDNDLFEKKKIEASSVYVDDINSFFYASTSDEEEMGEWGVDVDAEVGDVTYIGEVETVSPTNEEFTIDTGTTEMTVDTSSMLYNPLDAEGFQEIEVGDRVSVEAEVDADFLGNRELLAESVVTLTE